MQRSLSTGILRRARLTLVAGALTGAVLLAAVGPALTASAADPAPALDAATAQDAGERLEKLFRRGQTLLSFEKYRLALASAAARALEGFIADQEALGKNTAALEEGLAKYQAAIATAQSEYDSAKTALDTHAGFTAGGEVTDPQQAKETLKTAGKAERQLHRALKEARRDLYNAFKTYRQANKA